MKGFTALHLFAVVLVVVVGGVIAVSNLNDNFLLSPRDCTNCGPGGIIKSGQVGGVASINPIPDGDNQVKVKFPLFTNNDKLYLDDQITKVYNQITDKQLPTVLRKGTFLGNVQSSYEQWITINDPNNYSRIVFAKEPTSDYDPSDGIKIGTSSYNRTYTMMTIFSGAPNFTSPSSKGKKITLFGKMFTVSPDTTANKLVLISSSGERLTFEDGQSVKRGIDEEAIDLTEVSTLGNFDQLLQFRVIVAASDSDDDFIYKTTYLSNPALKEYHFTDPVFGTFKLTFEGMKNSGFYVKSESELGNTNDLITIGAFGINQIQIDDFKDWRNYTRDINWYDNSTGHPARLAYGDQDKEQIRVIEGIDVKKGQWVVIGNENYGHLFELIKADNNTNGNGYSDDRFTFRDVFDNEDYKTVITADGVGTVTVGGKTYGVTYSGPSTNPDNIIVRLNYPDSPNNGTGIFFPTIQTRMGAKMMFYQPTPINLYTIPTAYGGPLGGQFNLMLPNGNGYSTVEFTRDGNQGKYLVKDPVTLQTYQLDTLNLNSVVKFGVGELEYEVRGTGIQNRTTLYLHEVEAYGEPNRIQNPALVFFEEADDAGKYNALIVKIGGSATSTNPLYIQDIQRTWQNDAKYKNLSIERSGNDVSFLSQDRYGTITSLFDGNYPSGVYSGVILYPDKQSEALVYIQEI